MAPGNCHPSPPASNRDTSTELSEVTRYRAVLDNLGEGYSLQEPIFDAQGRPCDFRYLEINPAFERLLKLKREDLIGKTLRSAFPGCAPDWLSALAAVATTGEAVRLDLYCNLTRQYLSITVSSPGPGLVATFLTDITERQRTERALMQSAARFNHAERLAHIGSWELDLATRSLTWSDEIYRIFETDPKRLSASYAAFLDTIHPDDRAAVDAAYQRSLETHAPYSIDHRLRFPDGRIKYVHEECETIYEGNTPLRSIGTVQDVTGRTHIEYELRESEARFKMQYQGFPVPTYTWQRRGDDFVLIDYNRAAAAITHGRLASSLGASVREFFSDRPDVVEDLARAVAGESPLQREYRIRLRTTDEEKDLIVTYVALPPDFVMVHTEDVSERKRAEERLRQAAIVFENTLEGVLVTDADRKIVAVNRAFTSITGYSADEALGKNPSFIQSGRQDHDFYAEMWRSLDRRGQWRGEIWDRRKNGEMFPLWENISVVKGEDGRVVNYVCVFSDISVIKSQEARMTHLAHHDALTGLSNRLHFSANLDHAIELARRHHRPLALLFMDLDRFKMVNDTLGHAIGDQLLQVVAKRLRLGVRTEDTVARLGGDEFTITMSEIAHGEDAAVLAQKLIAAVREPITIGAYEMSISASIGIAIFPGNAADSEGLAKCADAALYRAKDRGRNTFEFYTPELTASALEHLATEQALRAALRRGEFLLHYQPEIDLATGAIVRVEALLRWRHPRLGLLMPDRFIQVAEDSGLIEPIGEWVLRTACTQAMAWRAAGLPGSMAINLSGRQIVRAGLVEKFAAILDETGARAGGVKLELEITEGVLNRVEQSRDVLGHLKTLGVRLALDDFGAGYSSLAHLRHLPIDTLKIDRSFIEELPGNPDAASIVQAIITLGHGLHLQLVAEGVETRAQQDFLRELRCDHVQGYLYSQALPTDAVEKLLATGSVDAH